MKNIFELLQNVQKEKSLNERQSILKEMQDAINIERVNTKIKPITGRIIAMKVAHIPTKDLYYLNSICKDYRNRKGSFGKCFFGSLKVVDK